MSAPETAQKALKWARNRQKGIRNDGNRDVNLPNPTI